MPVSAISARTQVSSHSRGGAVSEVQQALADAGFNPGPIDGDFGPQTRAAVMAFQQARGLEVDGVVGPQTWGALQGAAAPAPAASGGPQPQVSLGSRGPAVSTLQRQLAAAGFDPGGVDGDFGPMTRGAVLRFQAAHGLEVDGVVGAQTWGALGGSTFIPGAGPVRGSVPVSGDLRQRILAIAQNEVGTLEATGNNDGDVTKYPGAFGRGQGSRTAPTSPRGYSPTRARRSTNLGARRSSTSSRTAATGRGATTRSRVTSFSSTGTTTTSLITWAW